MGHWKIVRPEAATNLITNPSIEIDATGYTNSGTNTVARSSEQSDAGAYSLKCTYQDNTILASYAIELEAGTYLLYARVYIPSDWNGGAISVSSSGFAVAATTVQTAAATNTGRWLEIFSTQVIGSTDIGAMLIVAASGPTAGRYIYADAFMITASGNQQTYVDGDQPGCFWTGAPYASTSTRLQFDRRGGRVLDLADDLYFVVRRMVGTGMVESKNLTQPISNQGGASYDGNQTQPRHFSLMGNFNAGGDSLPTYHSRRRTLLKALNPKTNTDVDSTPLPVILRYTAANETKEIAAYYDGGLENGPDKPVAESDIALRFVATDPFFYELGRPAKALTTTDSATTRTIVRRVGLPQELTGDVWDSLGPPSASGTYTAVHAITEDNTYIYVGGNFANWNGIANADNIVRWHKKDRVWSALSTGADGIVRDLVVDAEGGLYAGGAFTTIGGVTCRGIALWDGSAWNALGPPSAITGDVYTIALDPGNGLVYIGGSFVNLDGNANADRIASWNGAAWSALSTGASDLVTTLVYRDATLYAAGNFTTIGGVSISRLATWNGSAFTAVTAAAFQAQINHLVFDDIGNFYVLGEFTDIGGESQFAHAAYWNGQAFLPLDTGADATLLKGAIDDDKNLFVIGSISEAGEVDVTGLARWNGSSWSHLDISLTGGVVATGTIYIARNGDLYIGFDASGTTTYAGVTTVSYMGSAENYPMVTIKRSGGTIGLVTSLRNESTDAEILLDHYLADGEMLTLELNPFTGIQAVSSFYGRVPGSILRGGDAGAFFLDPGNGDGAKSNLITCFVETSGSPTITGLLYYRGAYLSQD